MCVVEQNHCCCGMKDSQAYLQEIKANLSQAILDNDITGGEGICFKTECLDENFVVAKIKTSNAEDAAVLDCRL